MALMTINKMMTDLDIFKGKTRTSISNFLSSRNIHPVKRAFKEKDRGTAQGLYDIDVVIEIWQKNPPKKEFGAPKVEYSKDRKYKKPHECTDFEAARDAPFRNYKCPDYRDCMNNATLVLCCNDCENKNLIDPQWMLK